MKKKSVIVFALSLVALASCNGGNGGNCEESPFRDIDVTFERDDSEEIYYNNLGTYESLVNKAEEYSDHDDRLVAFAEAEAELLDRAVIMPSTTEGGNYAITRVAPHTVPYAYHGVDSDRLKGLVIATDFIKSADRADLMEAWKKACNGEGSYDPAALLKSKGYTIKTGTYATTYTTNLRTFDQNATYRAADIEYLANCLEGLVEYDNTGKLQCSGCESYEVSEDGLTYTFKIRDNNWVKSDGTVYAKVKAEDFVAGFQHALDVGYVSYLATGVVKNATEYCSGTKSFEEVGVKAVDDKTLVITLERPESFFVSRLCYNTFVPLCKAFYESKGGVFGATALKAAQKGDDYKFGLATDSSSQVYNGAFIPETIDCTNKSEIKFVKNAQYRDAEHTTFDTIRWVYDAGDNPTQTYADVKAGTYDGITLAESTGILALAKQDGLFDDYKYITDTSAATYFMSFILNRGTWEVGSAVSSQSELEKIQTHVAVNNEWFRKGVMHSIDRKAWNEVTRSAEVAELNLRNTYTPPEFTKLEGDKEWTVDGESHKFAANTSYGDVLQVFLDARDAHIKTADGQDGWYDPDYAKECFEKATQQLGYNVLKTVKLDNVYFSGSVSITAQASGLQKLIETGTDGYATIAMIETSTLDDYYYSGYYCDTGEEYNNDFYYGSGWSPDYNDGSTYLDTFKYGGDMMSCIGLE